jgi:hypothetical protein
MARSRNIKPGFFTNEILSELDPLARLLFIGLWTLADREGRLEDRPKRIKAELLPYDDCDGDALLDALNESGFIQRYETDAGRFIQIVTWHKHQSPHHMETPSEIPAPDGVGNRYNHSPVSKAQRERIFKRDGGKCKLCGSKKDLHIDHIQPVSKGGTSDDNNLRALCGKCNTRRGNNDDEDTSNRDQIDHGSTTNRDQINHGSTTNRDQIDHGSTTNRDQIDGMASPPTDSLLLIPDSLNSSAQQPPSLTPDSATPADENRAPLKAKLAKPSPPRAARLAVLLREKNVRCTSMHPEIVRWANELKVTDEEALGALEIARLRKPEPEGIPVAYLTPILLEIRKPPKAVNGSAGAWWASEQATLAKAKELGMTPRGGESWDQFRGRIRERIAQQETAA